jgi:amidase
MWKSSATRADVKSAADRLGMKLDDADTADYADLISGVLADLYAPLDELVVRSPKIKYPRTPGYRPDAGNNPNNAWYVKTAIEGAPSGPLKGRSVAIKDAIAVAGVPMMNGASSLEGYTPDEDATVVTRVLDAGGMISGKAHCEYFCYSGSSHTNAVVTITNPHNPEYTTGGSSSGCAALVAAGEVDMAIGGDQGGSIRAPASFCGIVGMKPTWGLVPFTGAASMEMTLDHLGPMTRTVADNALLLEVLAGPDGLDPRQTHKSFDAPTSRLGEGAKGLRIGVVREGFGHPQSQPAVDAAVRVACDLLRKAGADVREISIPMHRHGLSIWAPLAIEGVYEQMFRSNGVGHNWRGRYSSSYLEAQSAWRQRIALFPEGVKLALLSGEHIREAYHGRYYAKAQNLSLDLRAVYDAALADFDILVMPTVPVAGVKLPDAGAGRHEQLTPGFMPIVNTTAFDVSGHPAVSIPCAMIDGLPVGMMIIGRWFDDATVYRAAAAYEGLTDREIYIPKR